MAHYSRCFDRTRSAMSDPARPRGPSPSEAPIGIFDSGVGGLSVMKAIRAALPHEQLLYVADSANAPYGERSADFITARALAMAQFLVGHGAKAIVVACNTATVVAVDTLRARFSLPVVALEPAIKPAVALTRSGVVGVLATRRTLESPAVARLRAQHAGQARILLQACPGLVEQVERGDTDSAATRALLESYLTPLLEAGADTLVLGCTHYPFLAAPIHAIAGPGVTLVESSAAVARQLVRRLGGALHPGSPRTGPAERFFTTAVPGTMRTLVSQLWGVDVELQGIDAGEAGGPGA